MKKFVASSGTFYWDFLLAVLHIKLNPPEKIYFTVSVILSSTIELYVILTFSYPHCEE